MIRFLLVLCAVFLASCASMQNIDGVKVTDAERAECALTQTCEVWTERQLQKLIREVWGQGVQAGMKNGA
jgi:hypothetical protein